MTRFAPLSAFPDEAAFSAAELQNTFDDSWARRLASHVGRAVAPRRRELEEGWLNDAQNW